MNKEMVEIFAEFKKETENAVLIDYDGVEAWLPKSQIEYQINGTEIELMVPEWLAIDKELI